MPTKFLTILAVAGIVSVIGVSGFLGSELLKSPALPSASTSGSKTATTTQMPAQDSLPPLLTSSTVGVSTSTSISSSSSSTTSSTTSTTSSSSSADSNLS